MRRGQRVWCLRWCAVVLGVLLVSSCADSDSGGVRSTASDPTAAATSPTASVEPVTAEDVGACRESDEVLAWRDEGHEIVGVEEGFGFMSDHRYSVFGGGVEWARITLGPPADDQSLARPRELVATYADRVVVGRSPSIDAAMEFDWPRSGAASMWAVDHRLARAAQAQGASLYAAFPASTYDGEVVPGLTDAGVRRIAAVLPGGEVAFVGRCAIDNETRLFRSQHATSALVEQRGLSQQAYLELLMASDAEAIADFDLEHEGPDVVVP